MQKEQSITEKAESILGSLKYDLIAEYCLFQDRQKL